MKYEFLDENSNERSSSVLDLVHSNVHPRTRVEVEPTILLPSSTTSHGRYGSTHYAMKVKCSPNSRFGKLGEADRQESEMIAVRSWQQVHLHQVQDFFASMRGSYSELLVPNTPQQIGMVERLNCTLVEKTRALRLQASLPLRHWSDAAAYAVYLYNHTPHSSLNSQLPEEIWRRRSISIKHIHVFGSHLHPVPELGRGL